MSYQAGRGLGRVFRMRPVVTTAATLVVLSSLAALVYMANRASEIDHERIAATVAAEPPPPPPSVDPEDVKRGSVGIGARSLRAAMHDPTSFELDDATVMPDGTGCYDYRARNGFNALRKSKAVLTPARILVTDEGGTGFAGTWNKYCAGKSGQNITNAVKLYFLR